MITPFPLPAVKPLFRLRVGSLLFAGGNDGLDPSFQFRTSGNGYGALLNKGASPEYLFGDTGQQFTAVLPVHSFNGGVCSGVDSSEITHGRTAGTCRALDGNVAVVGGQFHTAFHRCAGPWGIALLVGKIVAAGALVGINAVQHSPNESAPGGFSALIRRIDYVQTVVQFKSFVLELAE